MQRDYFQNAYVTTDLDRAMADIGAQHGICHFMEMRESVFDTGPGRTAVCHFALANKGDLQFEIIQPLSGDIGVYRAVLPEAGYKLAFHHIGRHFDTRDAFDAALAAAAKRWAIPITHETQGGVFAYADARDDYGHFLELYNFPVGSHLDAVPSF